MRKPRKKNGYGHRGFTLLEVLVAVSIMAIALSSLLTSQMNAVRMNKYAREVSSAAFLAEQQLIEIEFLLKQEGTWGDNDREFEGDFSEEGWPDITYECLVDMVEIPDYQQIQQAADASETGGIGGGIGGGGPGGVDVQDAGEQAFDTLGLVWPMVKAGIEQSIRKASCTVYWPDPMDHDKENPCGEGLSCIEVMTFWTDPTQLTQLPGAGGEVDEEDDTKDPEGGGGPGGGPGGSGRGGGGGGGGGVKTPGGPTAPQGGRQSGR